MLIIPSLSLLAFVTVGTPELWDKHNWEALEMEAQQAMETGVFRYPYHNVLFAHSSPTRNYHGMAGDLFQPILKLKPRQLIIYNGERYRITNTEIIEPEQIEVVIQPRGTLLLITCYPIGSQAKRFVVFAKALSNHGQM